MSERRVPRGELDQKSLDNWRRIEATKRLTCLRLLREKTPASMMEAWKAQHEQGLRIGCDDVMFHLGVGMQVRNALRTVMIDDQLPPVQYPWGNAHNWDDFYMGALQDMVTDHAD